MFLFAGEGMVRTRIAVLPGLLTRNRQECEKIMAHIGSGQTRVREVDIFHEMVDLEMPDEDAEQSWSKDGWYCGACIMDLYRQRFAEWWKQAKAKGQLRSKLVSSPVSAELSMLSRWRPGAR